jgi:hypothetical protein
MATLTTRINSSGTYFVNGSFDEITTSTIRTTTNTVYTSLLDEVTYNTTTPAIKNLFKYTETFNFDFTNWTLNGGTMTQNAILAPNRRSLAPKLVEVATLGNQRIYNWMPVTAGTTYTYSIFLKAAERYIVRCYFEDSQAGGGGRVGQYLNLQTGTIISTYLTGSNTLLGSNLQNVGDGWYRFSWTVTAQLSAALNSTAFMIIGMADASSNFNYTGDGTSGMYIWGAQMEVSNAVTDYQGIAATNTLVAPGFAKREAGSRTSYVTGSFDEFTGAPIVDSSLIQWVDAAQTASYPGSGTTWSNLSGGGSFSLSSSTFTTVDGGAIVWPNGPAQGSFTPQPNITGAHTISVWVKPTLVNASTIKRYVTLGSDSVVLRNDGINQSGQIHYYLTVNSVITSLRVNSQVVANQPVNFVATWDGSTMTLYKNGVSIGTQALSGTLQTTTNWDAISGTTEPFVGNMYQIQMYNRALSADEIAQNFNALRRRYGL